MSYGHTGECECICVWVWVCVCVCMCLDGWVVGWRVVSLCTLSCQFLCTVYGHAFHLVLGRCKLPAFHCRSSFPWTIIKSNVLESSWIQPRSRNPDSIIPQPSTELCHWPHFHSSTVGYESASTMQWWFTAATCQSQGGPTALQLSTEGLGRAQTSNGAVTPNWSAQSAGIANLSAMARPNDTKRIQKDAPMHIRIEAAVSETYRSSHCSVLSQPSIKKSSCNGAPNLK